MESNSSSSALRDAYCNKTAGSAYIYREALKHTPFGVHSNWRIFDPHPLFIRRAKGSRIWDADNNEYIDYNMAFGALAVGHAHPLLVDEVRRVVGDGTIYGFETEYSVKLARELKSRYGYQMVRYSTTGLEATLLAIRLARAFTGRRKVLKFEGCFHGTHEMALVSVKPDPYKAGHPREPNPVPASWGMPDELKNLILVAPYNDYEATEKVMRRWGNEVAAIIIEPIAMNMGVVVPDIDFLRGLRELADEYYSLLIFDEVKTCGKFYRGVQDWCGVRGDIMVAAKSIAGGYPLSAVLTSEEVMDVVGPKKTAHGGTFNSNILSVTAAYVTLTKILDEDSLRNTHQLCERLARGYHELLDDARVPHQVVNIASSGVVYFSSSEVRNWRDFINKVDFGRWYTWFIGMVVRGVIPQAAGYDEQWTVSTQHTREDIDNALEAMKYVVREVKSQRLAYKAEEAL